LYTSFNCNLSIPLEQPDMSLKKRKIQDAGLIKDLQKSLEIAHEFLEQSQNSVAAADAFQEQNMCFDCHRSNCICEDSREGIKTLQAKLDERNNLVNDLLGLLGDLNYNDSTRKEWFKKKGYCIKCYDRDCECGIESSDDEKDEKEKAETKIPCPDCKENLIVEEKQDYCDSCHEKMAHLKFQCLGCTKRVAKPGTYHDAKCQQQDSEHIKDLECGRSFCQGIGFKRHPNGNRILCEPCYQKCVLNDAYCQKLAKDHQVKF
jgi:hypothetical protein